MRRIRIAAALVLMAGAVTALFAVRERAAYALSDDARDAIAAAGREADDVTRVRVLARLAQRTDLTDRLRDELDELLDVADEYAGGHGRWLNRFRSDIREYGDYVIDVGQRSPLRPLADLYRGRMLVWYALQVGTIWHDEERRAEELGRAREVLESVRDAFPDNPIVRMYLGEPIASTEEYRPHPAAPAWANHQREALERLGDIVEWWIDHRQQEDGQFGGGFGDDCEMWRFWAPLLVAFEAPLVSASQVRFSRALLAQDHLAGGYTSRMTDVEHSAEYTTDALMPLLLAEPESPEWIGWTRRLVRLAESTWMGENERGLLHFKSAYFTSSEVDSAPARGCDTVYHVRVLEPALLLWQRTADPDLTRLLARWLDAWVDATARAERGKPAGVIPTAVRWPDGAVGGVGDDWWRPRIDDSFHYDWPTSVPKMAKAFLVAFQVTGDDRYLAPIRSMAAIQRRHLEQPVDDAEEGSLDWCAARISGLSEVAMKCRLLTGTREFDPLLDRIAGGHARFLMTGEVDELTDELRLLAETLRYNGPGFTSEVRYTDRVLSFPELFQPGRMVDAPWTYGQRPHVGLLYRSATGDVGHARQMPMNAVRWRTPPRDIAALVHAATATSFEAELFHFGEEPRPLAMELLALAPGDYRWELSEVAGGDRLATSEIAVASSATRVELEIPGGRLCRVVVAPR